MRAYLLIIEKGYFAVIEEMRAKYGAEPEIKAFDVLGPYDVMMEVDAEDLTDLTENYVRRVNNLQSVAACHPYVAVGETEPKLPIDSPFAYLLIDAEQPKIYEIQKEIYGFDGTQKVDVILGTFDLMSTVKVKDFDGLKRYLHEVKKVKGIVRGITMIVIYE